MNSKNSLFFFLIFLLLMANAYQVYLNRLLKKEMFNTQQSQKQVDNAHYNLDNTSNFYIEQYILQNFAPPTNFSFYDFNDNEIDINEVYKWNGLVLHINDVNCTDCNINRLKVLLQKLNTSGLQELLVIANFESQAEFKNLVIESGLEKYKVYNSTFKLKQLYSDTILLFYFNNKAIMYPFVVDDSNINNITPYFEFIKMIYRSK